MASKKNILIAGLLFIIWGLVLFMAVVFQNVESENGGCYFFKYSSIVVPMKNDYVICGNNIAQVTKCTGYCFSGDSCASSMSDAYCTTTTCRSCIFLWIVVGVGALLGSFGIYWQFVRKRNGDDNYQKTEG